MYYFPSTWKRLLARLTDDGIVLALQSPVLFFVLFNYFKFGVLKIHWAHIIYCFAVKVVYETLMLTFYSATLGKKIFKLKVINNDGQIHLRNYSHDVQGEDDVSNNEGEFDAVSWQQALLRSLGSTLSFFFGWSLFATAFFSYGRRHLIDKLAETQVVGFKPREESPKIRWIFAVAYILIFFPDSLKKSAKTLNQTTYESPYLVLNFTEWKNFFKDWELQWEWSQDSDDVEDSGYSDDLDDSEDSDDSDE